ncbi:MAG: hemolysin III family protein [Promethearchaeota archaeon]|nr:MAG: hemolysin III family protein [Candidatus Lokiarchaeota archaeon]
MSQIQELQEVKSRRGKLFNPFIKLPEERFSTYSHLVGAALSIIGTILIGIKARGDPWSIVLGIFYGFTNIFLFGSSAMCHSQSVSEHDHDVWAKLDEIAIFFLIAGTYTPMLYIFLFQEGEISWFIGMLSAQWVFALAGMTVKLFEIRTPRWFTAGVYLVQGFMVFAGVHKIFVGWHWVDLIFMILGGLAYAGGTIFYITKKPKLWPGIFGPHDLWHVLVLIGATSFYIVIFRAI